MWILVQLRSHSQDIRSCHIVRGVWHSELQQRRSPRVLLWAPCLSDGAPARHEREAGPAAVLQSATCSCVEARLIPVVTHVDAAPTRLWGAGSAGGRVRQGNVGGHPPTRGWNASTRWGVVQPRGRPWPHSARFPRCVSDRSVIPAPPAGREWGGGSGAAATRGRRRGATAPRRRDGTPVRAPRLPEQRADTGAAPAAATGAGAIPAVREHV